MPIFGTNPFWSKYHETRFLASYDARAKHWPVPFETNTIPGKWGTTFIRISGQKDATPLVLLHGIGNNGLSWIPNIEDLSRHYRVIVIDHICDMGRSLNTAPFKSVDDHLDWLDESFTLLDLCGRFHLAGISYGGWLSAQYALKFPRRLEKLVLIAPAATILPLSPIWTLRAILCGIPIRMFTSSFLRWLAQDLAKSGNQYSGMMDELIDEIYLAVCSFRPKLHVFPTVLSDEQLRRLSEKTLFLVGENEKIYDPHKALKRINSVAPYVLTKLIRNAGHDLTIAQPRAVNNEVLNFLRR